jgi:hypothetical protein
MMPLRPTMTGSSIASGPPMGQPLAPSKPNYEISLTDITSSSNAPMPPFGGASSAPSSALGAMQAFSSPPSLTSPPMGFAPTVPSFTPATPSFAPGASSGAAMPLFAARPAMGVLMPSKPAQQWNNGSKQSQTDWGDFDPLA